MGSTKAINTDRSELNNGGNPRYIDDAFDHNESEEESSGSSSSDEDTISFSDSREHQGSTQDPSPVTCWNILSGITIEPMMLAHMFGMQCTSVVLQNLYIERICTVSLNHNATVCSHLDDYATIENEVDVIASKFVTYRSFIEAGFPILVALFLGPWTDVHGTKKMLLLPLFGYFLSAISYLILGNIKNAPPELLLISSIPISAVGGLVAIIMSAFSFMSKTTTVENRSFRVAMLEASWFLGGPIGVLLGGVIYKYGGFSAVFITSASSFLLAFAYGLVVIREEVPEIEGRENTWISCIVDMFNVQAVKDMVSTVFSRRSGHKRMWLLLMLLTISLRIFALFGYIQNMYLYTKKRFHWDIKEYTEYSVTDSLMAISGGYVMIMICMKIFKLPDAMIGILSTIGIFFSQFIFAFAVGSWMIYLGASLQIFAGLISIVLRSMISKIVAKEEIAKVFTFLACGEAAMPLIGVPIYSYIFRHTITTFPGAMFMLSAAVYLVIIISFIYLFLSMRHSNEHVQMQDPGETPA